MGKKILIKVGTVQESNLPHDKPFLLALLVKGDTFVRINKDETDSLTEFAVPLRNYISKLSGNKTTEVKSVKNSKMLQIKEGKNTVNYRLEPITGTEFIDLYQQIFKTSED